MSLCHKDGTPHSFLFLYGSIHAALELLCSTVVYTTDSKKGAFFVSLFLWKPLLLDVFYHSRQHDYHTFGGKKWSFSAQRGKGAWKDQLEPRYTKDASVRCVDSVYECVDKTSLIAFFC